MASFFRGGAPRATPNAPFFCRRAVVFFRFRRFPVFSGWQAVEKRPAFPGGFQFGIDFLQAPGKPGRPRRLFPVKIRIGKLRHEKRFFLLQGGDARFHAFQFARLGKRAPAGTRRG